jgi:predicted DNA-binding transcriptional regulator YafY
MTKVTFDKRVERRTRLLGLLRSEEHWTSADLREQLGISQRTLMRELSDLRDAGYPIDSDRGRGGGIRLNGRWGIERLNLSHQEVVELILALAVMENLQSPLLTGNLKAIRQKLFQAFPQEQRSKVNDLRKRILIGDKASKNVASFYKTPNASLSETIASGFLQQQCLEIDYLSEAYKRTTRMIEPHYILLNWPAWYIIAWDHLRTTTRTFRIDRIKRTVPLDQAFSLRPKTQFQDIFADYFEAI